MSPSRFMSLIIGRRQAFLATLCCVIAIFMLGTYLVPPRYTATAELLVEDGRAAAGPNMTSRVVTEAALMQSERVSIAALGLLGLRNDPALMKEWKEKTDGRGEFESWAAEQLSRKLDVKPSRDSNVLAISYSSPDPVLAAKTVNAFVKAYVDTAVDLRGESAAQSSASFSQRTSRLKAALDLAGEKLATFQRENGVAFTDERLDIETLRLSELNAQLVALQSAAANAAGRQRQAATNASGMEEVLRDPLVAVLSADLARQQAKFAELKARAGDSHPAVAEQRDTIADLKSRLDVATKRASSAIATDSRIASERAGSIAAALASQRAKVMEVKAKRDQAQRLQLDLDLARRAYDAAVTRANEAVLDSGASRGNVSVVKTATVPAKPTFPRPTVNLAASIVMGLLAAILVVLWRESRDRRLRLDQDVPELLEQPLLGLISHDKRSTPLLLLSHR